MVAGFRSYFNDEDSNKVYITPHEWGTTMICNSTSCGIPSDLLGSNHALLLVEGINQSNTYFRILIDFQGPSSSDKPVGPRFEGSPCKSTYGRIGRVRISDRTGKRVYYTHKSETWLRSAEKVSEMVERAKREKESPAEHPRAFSICGSRSLLSPKVSAYKITNPTIQELATHNQKVFKYLYKTAKRCIELYGFDILNDQYFFAETGFFCTDGGYDILSKALVYLKQGKIINPPPRDGLLFELDRIPTCPLARRKQLQAIFRKKHLKCGRLANFVDTLDRDRLVNKLFLTRYKLALDMVIQECSDYIREYLNEIPELKPIIDQKLQEFNGDVLALYRDVLKMVANSTDLVSLTPDSCFTWAREKLAVIGVKLEDKPFEQIVSRTKNYLTPR